MADSRIFEKVNKCLEQYIGGEVFFDELDNSIKFDKELLRELYRKAKSENPNCGVIASGEIGLCLHNYGFKVDILVPGGLRKNAKILNLEPFVCKGREYIFIDDSYFSGKTAQIIQEEVERCNAKLKCVWVAYDGSYFAIHNVKSLYRYYDNFDILGREK